MSGDAHIAKRIGKLQEDQAVKKCLAALFTHELSNADKIMPTYRPDYEKHIASNAKAWEPETSTGVAD